MSEKDSNTEMDATEIISDLHNQLHSLRLAVLKYVKRHFSKPDKCSDLENDLALSAGIEFKNGTWILKETTGEGE